MDFKIFLFTNFLYISINWGKSLKLHNNIFSGLYNEEHYFKNFSTFHSIIPFLVNLRDDYHEKIQFFSIGETYEGRDILIVRISEKMNQKNNPAILIDGGIHAREWISTSVALYIIYQLVKKKNNSYLLKNFDWYIIPVLNPDGYDYSFKNDRLWRKNRSPGSNCRGVDINRNFEHYWGFHGGSKNECSLIYTGSYPFSEQESTAFRDFVLNQSRNLVGYVSLHSFGNKIVFPWGYTTKRVYNYKQYQSVSNKMISAIKKVRGTLYEGGQLSEVLYSVSGITIDWMTARINVPFSFVFEIGKPHWHFMTPEKEIIPISKEIFEAFKVLYNYIKNKNYFRNYLIKK